ncbi:glycosyltransferase [Agreia bicolorata]|uniref:glycosyltransferase n=1 Tax=Agreia bicolorata TaxID=110935 RepID=UPI000AFD41BB
MYQFGERPRGATVDAPYSIHRFPAIEYLCPRNTTALPERLNEAYPANVTMDRHIQRTSYGGSVACPAWTWCQAILIFVVTRNGLQPDNLNISRLVRSWTGGSNINARSINESDRMNSYRSEHGPDRKSVAIIGTRGYPSYYGGFETAVRRLAPYLAARGWDVTVYGRRGTSKSGDPDDNRIRSVVTWGLESKSLSTLTYGFSATAHAAATRPQVALVMNVANGYFLPLLRLRSIPTLVNVDGVEWKREKWGRIAKAMFLGGAKATARHATRLVHDSVHIGDMWAKDFQRDGAFIPYGGDVPDDLPVPPGLAHGKFVLFVARFVPENTFWEFLQAAKHISEDYKVVIVGSSGYGGELDNAARRLASDSPNVTWMGHVSDDSLLHSLWQHAGVYFHGHSVGGTNPALVQAMACGAPTVARDTVFNREVLGEYGVFVDPDAKNIANAIRQVMQSQQQQSEMRIQIQARAREHYAWEAVCASYENELKVLLAKPQ